MHITIYHNAVIPPCKYGGTERVIFWLGKALIALGHRVTLLSKPGSSLPGAKTIATSPNLHWQDQVPHDADILHLWSTPPTLPNKPFLVTIEGNGQYGETFHPNTIFVSKNHAQRHGAKYFVYNGIDPEDYGCDEKRTQNLVFLAKASWKVKNLKGALVIARQTHHSLLVMGSRDWPLNLQKKIRFPGQRVYRMGMVGDVEKREILKKSKALLFPVRWHEPFGVALLEALASGCPVFGTPYGSLPEIISLPEVGFLSTSALELSQALQNYSFHPLACRDHVVKKFTHLHMAKNYLYFYEEILKKGTLDQNQIGIKELNHSNPNHALLPFKWK